MTKRQTVIQNQSGLHARPASEFVLLAKTYSSAITIRNLNDGSDPVNAKSIVRLLAEGMGQGTPVELTADGPDEEIAINKLVALIESGFGE